jgi:hypothetical protein
MLWRECSALRTDFNKPGSIDLGSTLIPLTHRTTMPRVNFLVHYILPVFKYVFFVGLIGAVPVIIVTAVKTAQSMLEED